MSMYKLLLTLLISSWVSCVFGQRPKELMYFFNKSDRWCMNSITLSSDSVYFYSGSCESDAALAKGKWRIDSNRLTLSNFDRKDAWPAATVTAKEFYAADSVHFTITDYFGKPYRNLLMVFFDSTGKEDEVYADSNGCIIIPKDRCFVYDFNYRKSMDNRGVDSLSYTVKPHMNDIAITIDYPGYANLEHEIRTIDFEHLEFIINEGMLYDETGKVVYDNKYLSAVPEQKPISKPAKTTEHNAPAHE